MAENDDSKPRGVRHTVELKTETVTKAFPLLGAQASRQSPDDFAGSYSGVQDGHTIVEPMYPPAALNRYAAASGSLRTCIDAMSTNIDGHGFTLEYIGEEDAREGTEAQDEFNRVMGLLDHPNGEYSLIDLRRQCRADKESCGYSTVEILRNPDDGFPDTLYHVPSHSVRMTAQDDVSVDVLRYMPRPGADRDGMVRTRARFRRFVQISNGKRIYFKDVGDPRAIDALTGKPRAEDAEGDNLASEILMDSIYTPGSRYGAPRWIGALRSVLGIQESENMNLGYFKDNGIPAMIMFVLGGAMTETAVNQVTSGMQANRGSNMQQKVMIVPVDGDPNLSSREGMVPRPDVKVEALVKERQTDAFFQDFETNAAKKIRSTFRLPALFSGLTEEVRYAVAEASLIVAENQVFGPERNQTDDLYNYRILTYNGRPMRFWRLRSSPPQITSSEAVMDALKVFDDVGAMTPNIAIGLANELFGLRIESIAEKWGDMPFALAREAFTAHVAQGGQPGQTGTPGEEGGDPPAGDGSRLDDARQLYDTLFSEPEAAAASVRRRKAEKRAGKHRDARRAPGATLKTATPSEAAPKPLTRGVSTGSADISGDGGAFEEVQPEAEDGDDVER